MKQLVKVMYINEAFYVVLKHGIFFVCVRLWLQSLRTGESM